MAERRAEEAAECEAAGESKSGMDEESEDDRKKKRRCTTHFNVGI